MVYITLSDRLSDVLPALPNPPSPYRQALTGRTVVDLWSETPFVESQALLEALRGRGVSDLLVIRHPWQRCGYDDCYPAVLPVRAEWGGEEALRALAQTARQAGYLFALHENYVDFYPDAGLGSPDDLALDPDGNPRPAWFNETTGVQSYLLSPFRALAYARQNAPEIHRRYGTSAAFVDVHTAVPPWEKTDYNARFEGRARFLPVFRAYADLLAYLRAAHEGPVLGEGGAHFLYAGLIDGVAAEDERGPNTLPLVDFALLRLHPLMVNYGVGYFPYYFAQDGAPKWSMKQFLPLMLCLSILLSACRPAPTETLLAPTPTAPVRAPTETPLPHPLTVTYAPSAADFPNPERGFYEGGELGDTDLTWYPAETGNHLLHLYARLDDFRRRDLTPEFLAALENFFILARQAGVKVIVRFSYNHGETYPLPAPDASLEQALRHIEQLAPVLEANKDVIAWFEAGFIGAWGEWHTSASGLDSPEAKATIRDALYAHFPHDRFILFRYPGDFTRWYPQPLSEAQAFDGSDQARTGHHNDCFLASEDDWGTYDDYDGSLQIEAWKTYIAAMTRFAPMSGETCNPNPPRSDCPTALAELERLHWTALNEAYHPDVIQGWKDQSCYAEIRQRLGYRLSLLEASFPAQVRPGETLSLQIRLQNTGFASPLLPRPVYLVLVTQDSILRLPLETDPRRWEPGEHTLTADLSLPADLPPGEYTLSLWLPDPAESLRDDPRYAVRLANEDVWDAERGWNVLGTLTVTE